MVRDNTSMNRLQVFLIINYSDEVYVIMFRQPEHNYFGSGFEGVQRKPMCWRKRVYYYTLHLHPKPIICIVLGATICRGNQRIWDGCISTRPRVNVTSRYINIRRHRSFIGGLRIADSWLLDCD